MKEDSYMIVIPNDDAVLKDPGIFLERLKYIYILKMENYPKPVTRETYKKISDYLDNSIYLIKVSEEKDGLGFFCSLKCHDKKVFVLITNYQTVN